MRIFLDGCDGTGKSTLAKYLSDRFKIDIFSLTKDSEKSLSRYIELDLNDTVYDRTFLSEVVYPEFFGRKPWLHSEVVKSLIEFYKSRGLFIICSAHPKDIQHRILVRGAEYMEVTKNIEAINKAYIDIAKQYNLLVVNTSIMTMEQIGDEIERRLKND